MSAIRSQATPARDELAALSDTIWRTETTDFGGYSGRDARAVADHLWAEGYRKPRTVNSAAELHKLPVESVVRNANGWIGEISIVSGKPVIFWIGNECEAGLDEIALPATVLFTPGDAG